jgi:hypothetical protein
MPNNKELNKKILLFDMDLIAFRSAAAVEKRSITALHKATNKSKVFNTRTELKDFLKEKGLTFKPNAYVITDMQAAPDESHAYQIVKTQINNIAKQLNAEICEGYIGGSNNFRINLDLPVKYKSNRDDTLRPLLLDKTKDYVLSKYVGGLIEGMEVDDHVVLRSHELRAAGFDPVVVSIDKDCRGCVGIKIYNWTDENPEVFEVPVFGSLSYDKDKLKVHGAGLNFYCYQLLRGDPSDGYSPADLHKQRFGDVAAVNALKQAKSVLELREAVVEQYRKWFPEPVTYTTWDGRTVTKNYEEILELYHACVYMLRTEDDQTTFFSYMQEFIDD